ncbi:MAG: polyprenol monophosphomannose synthase [Bdellovibrionaceae bacterium]|nr:polyprenol monophosphomannose synthase [Pseudobdellovibrionaceae bacterium]
MRTLVIIPTYNERENISLIVRAVLTENPGVEVLVVDDNSPDGTAQVVQSMQAEESRLHLLLRSGKEGLGRAYIAGFEWGLARGYECLVEMDADFSHRPQDLKLMLEAIGGYDFVVGSRYVQGGRTLNWGLGRKLISRGGGIYSRLILGFPLNDWTGGFNAWRAETLKKINLSQVKSNGYSFQIELKYRALRAGCRGIEVPIVFEDRRVGQSKMSFKIVVEAFYRVWLLRFQAK